jgi:hypothetical protein
MVPLGIPSSTVREYLAVSPSRAKTGDDATAEALPRGSSRPGRP